MLRSSPHRPLWLINFLTSLHNQLGGSGALRQRQTHEGATVTSRAIKKALVWLNPPLPLREGGVRAR